MTIETALRRLGHDVRREVLPNGRLRFIAGKTFPASGLALQPHRFHGGDPIIDDGIVAHWSTGDDLARDRAAMALHFPSWAEHSIAGAPTSWAGTIDTGNGRFRVRVTHRRDRELPRVQVVSANLSKTHPRSRRSTPHLYTNGDLCVADRADWEAEEMTIADVVGWSAHWLACYVAWIASSKWPTDGYVAAPKAA